jgi:hypothetical protein
VNLGLASFAEQQLDGDFFWINTSLLLAALPLYAHPYASWRLKW